MRRLILPAFLALLLAPAIPAQAATWTPDQAHSEVDFSILHMSLSNVHGRFGNVTGAVHFDPGDMANSFVNVTIDVVGIDTGESARDAVLKSTGFFNVEKYPTATFVSTKVDKTADGWAVTGNLTLCGVTKSVVLTVEGPQWPGDGHGSKAACRLYGYGFDRPQRFRYRLELSFRNCR